eukprot:7595236-Prorocentrum_lima.AAC.1
MVNVAPAGGRAPSSKSSTVVHDVVNGADVVGGAEAPPIDEALGRRSALALALATAWEGSSVGNGEYGLSAAGQPPGS